VWARAHTDAGGISRFLDDLRPPGTVVAGPARALGARRPGEAAMAGGGRRWGWWILLGGVATLAVASALDPEGLRKYQRLSREVESARAVNADLAAENQRLAREVRGLRTDPAALERAAREELQYVRPGERVYLFGGDEEPRR
jgi:cell division protein FtsB